ncbi:MAG: hypothetical protein ACK41C_12015 [Phenylobacterium sp.]|uniref:hypothetical protein n=1 Tax=Phenylobacterium sp. TaxID=1871053 RepID=UPI00391A4B0D
MSDDLPGEPRKGPGGRPIPVLLWAALGVLAVVAFVFVMRALNPPTPGRTPPMTDLPASAPQPLPMSPR